MHPVEQILDHTFSDKQLLTQALTHSSTENAHYERLEFLGDRVLNLCIAARLYKNYPTADEGKLAKHHAALVRTETLATMAKELGVSHHIILGQGEEQSGGRTKPNILADVMEALIGALYIDAGYETAAHFINTHWQQIEKNTPLLDAKSALQEHIQQHNQTLPIYTVIATEGEVHDPTYTIEVKTPLGRAEGKGSSKQAAGQAAATALLNQLDIIGITK